MIKRQAIVAAIAITALTGAMFGVVRAQAPADGLFTPGLERSSVFGGQIIADDIPHQPTVPFVRPSRLGVTRLSGAVSPNSSSILPAAPPIAEPLEPMTPGAVYMDQLNSAAPPEVRPAGLTESTLTPANQISLEPQEPLPPGAREGVFQKLYFTGTWIPAIEDEADALGFGELETGVVFGFPFMRRDTPLLVTPQFGVHFLENSAALDIPSKLFDASIEFRHLRRFGQGPFAMDVAATVGYYSDFEQDADDALRITGRAIGVYEASPQTKWLLGVGYFNRAGATVLPIGGLIYEPTPDMRWELVFPKPRIAWKSAASAPCDERWWYVAGEFGGGVWSITRPSSGALDLIDYSDWRLLAGYERKVTGGLTRRYEVGYVFNRELEFDSATPEATLDDSLLLRAGFTY